MITFLLMSDLTPAMLWGHKGGENARVHMSSWQRDAVTPVFLFHTWLLRDRKKEIKSHMTFFPFVCAGSHRRQIEG